jgi:ferric-dicitrate binding protein FerR (iron transport regulator)
MGVSTLYTEAASYGYRIQPTADASYTDQTRRRAARWHAWLKSPECTLQDRENFERWCSDPANAAAYVTLCGGLAWAPELASDFADEGFAAEDLALHASAPPVVASR